MYKRLKVERLKIAAVNDNYNFFKLTIYMIQYEYIKCFVRTSSCLQGEKEEVRLVETNIN